MASSTSSAPITSSRGAADTTTGQIYFSTPSAQVRVPVGDLGCPPPPTYAHTILLGWKIIRRRKNLSGGVKNYPGQNIYKGASADGKAGADGTKIRKKIRKLSDSAENTLFPILRHCETIPYPYTLPKTLS